MYAPFDDLLDALISAGEEEFEDDWPDELEKAFSDLEGSYRKLRDPQRTLIDYGSLPFQAAYVFKYSPCRASFVATALKHFEQASSETLFVCNDELSLALLGGGPGSEIPGIIDYFRHCKEYSNLTKINFTIFDKEPAWSNVVEGLKESYVDPLLGDITFEVCDFSVKSVVLPDLSDFDGAFLSYFISEICALPKNDLVRSNIAKSLSNLPEYATVIYIDSNAPSFYGCMNAIRKMVSGLEEVSEFESNLSISFPESEVFCDFVDENDHRPHLNGRILAKHMAF